MITGGFAKNIGFVHRLENLLGMKRVSLQGDPQIAGAIGAALFAGEMALEGKKKAEESRQKKL